MDKKKSLSQTCDRSECGGAEKQTKEKFICFAELKGQ